MFALVFFVFAVATTAAATTIRVSPQCEAVTVRKCSNLGFNLTVMPNVFNHATQEEAHLEMHQFWPLVKIRCSPDLKTFLCSAYLPECVHGVATPPSRTLCESSRRGCEAIMNNFGLAWPNKLDCSNFQVEDWNDVARRTTNPTNTSQDNVTNRTHQVLPQCEAIAVPTCSNLGYNNTVILNINHATQDEAFLEIYQFMPLVKIRCSPDLLTFLCSAYLPECVHGVATPPSRTLCESSRRGCEPVMSRFGFLWPDVLDCSKFPVVEGNNVEKTTDSPVNSIQPPTNTSQDNVTEWTNQVLPQCEATVLAMCSNLGFNNTVMPNMFNHTTQEEAHLEMHQFMPLGKTNCSADLDNFLCSVFLPECVHGVATPPSRTLCESSKRGCEPLMNRFGFQWPDKLDCSKLPLDDVTIHDSSLAPSWYPGDVSQKRQSTNHD